MVNVGNLVTRANPLSMSGRPDVFDDILFSLGTDRDAVLVLNTAGLSADEELTDVIEGTSVHPATAANSLIISNITNDGDVLMLASDGGNSKAFLFFDASAPDLYLYNVGGTWTAGATAWTIPAVTLGGAVAGGDQAFTGVGDMTFTAGSILASGSTNADTLILRANDTAFITFTTGATDECEIEDATMKGTWLADGTVTMPALTLGAALTLNSQDLDAGSGNLQVTTSGNYGGILITSTASGAYGVRIRRYMNSSSPAANDSVALDWYTGKNDAAQDVEYHHRYTWIDNVGDGSEGCRLQWDLMNGGAIHTAMKLSAAGEVSGDLAYAVFDEWDDKAVVLQRDMPPKLRRVAIAEQFVEMGVVDRKDNGEGYMLNLQQSFWFNFHALKVAFREIDNLAIQVESNALQEAEEILTFKQQVTDLKAELAKLKAS